MEKIVFTTGGTGGHIYPALSIAKEIVKKGDEVLFIGSLRMEKELIPNEGYRFIGLDVQPLKNLKSIIKMIKAIIEINKIFKDEKPTKVIGFGNYISLPSLIVAKFRKIPYYLQEQNSSMGMANKYFYKTSKKTFIAFENTLSKINDKYKNKFIVTGNPLREEFYEMDKKNERKKNNISSDKKILLVIGGSLGAQNINKSILNNVSKITVENNIKLYWSTGKNNFNEINNKIRPNQNLVVAPYFDNVASLMAISDLVISRAGASTISELIQLEKPAIMIPYDYVGQRENAEVIEFIDGGKIYDNDSVENAITEAISLIQNDDTLEFMEENIRSIKKGNAVRNILDEIYN